MNLQMRLAAAPRRVLVWGLAGTLLAALPGLATAADAAAPAKAVKPAGIPVQVTPEMIGAGIVSSGVKLPPIPPVTGNRANPVPSWGKPLPYPIVIADRRNNRLIEVTPDKRIVWEFPSPNLKRVSRQRGCELLGRRQAARGQRGRQLRRAHRRLRKRAR